jgi:hypothetical protein
MSIPTKGEQFSILIEHLRKGQEACSMLAHLHRDDSKLIAQGWLAVGEMLKKTIHNVTTLATRGLQ